MFPLTRPTIVSPFQGFVDCFVHDSWGNAQAIVFDASGVMRADARL